MFVIIRYIFLFIAYPFSSWLQSGGFKEGANCDMCQRIAGEVMCSPKMCAPCPLGFFLVRLNWSLSARELPKCTPGTLKYTEMYPGYGKDTKTYPEILTLNWSFFF